MKLKTLAFLTISVLSTSLWADYSGHYTCETVHRGKEIKPQLDLSVKGNTYHEILKWEDQTRERDLIATSDPTIFLSYWEYVRTVGVSSWHFKDSSVTQDRIFFDKKDGKKYMEQSVCKKT